MRGAIFDGTNIWVTDLSSGKLFKLDSNGAILQTVTVTGSPQNPVFDGSNIWVPLVAPAAVKIVRASTGVTLTTLTDNIGQSSVSAAFDGQRVLVTNNSTANVSLWKAADFSPLGVLSTGSGSFPYGACSDGVNFWITLQGGNRLARF